MNIPQISIFNDYENINNNYSCNIFNPSDVFESELKKENIFLKDSQKQFLFESKLNSGEIIDSSSIIQTHEKTYMNSLNNSIILNKMSINESSPKIFASSEFQTKVNNINNNDNEINKKKENRLLLNRLSARKSRIKKKNYIKSLEEDNVRLKKRVLFNVQNKNSNSDNNNNNNIISNKIEYNEKNDIYFLNKIILLKKQEKEVKKEGQRKKADVVKQHEVLQKMVLNNILIKQINYFMPLKYKIFGENYIKLVQINDDDSLSVIVSKINENINKIKDYENIVSKKKIKFVKKMYEIYKKIKDVVDNYQQLFNESFKF